jgi:hypothetical protein
MSSKYRVALSALVLMAAMTIACGGLTGPDPRLKTWDASVPQAQKIVNDFCTKSNTDWGGIDQREFIQMGAMEESDEPGKAKPLPDGVKGKCVIVQFQTNHQNVTATDFQVSPAQLLLPPDLQAATPEEAKSLVLLGYFSWSDSKTRDSGRSVPVKGETITARVVEIKTKKVLAEFQFTTRTDDSTSTLDRKVPMNEIASKIQALKRL